jgi:hypothetical protein
LIQVPRPGIEPGLYTPSQQNEYQQHKANKFGHLHYLALASAMADLGVFAAKLAANQPQIFARLRVRSAVAKQHKLPQIGPSRCWFCAFFLGGSLGNSPIAPYRKSSRKEGD